MPNAGPDDSKAAIKIAGRNINNLRYPDDTTVMAESKEELKSLLMRVKEESEKADLKLNIKDTNIMVSSPNTSWQIDGEKVETVTDFIFLGSKITADSDCSHEIKTLAPWRKSRDITLLTNVHIVIAMIFFPVVMYKYESWTIKKASTKELTLSNCDAEDS